MKKVLLTAMVCLLFFSMFSVLLPKVKAESVTLETLWTYPITDNVNFCSDIGDVDGDGYQDVAILNLHWPSGPATVQIIKSDGTSLWSVSINYAGTGIALEDTNYDGKDEVYVFGTTGSPPHFGDPIISSYDGNGNLLWQFTVHETSPWSRCIDFVTFVNLDSDPQLEIVGIGNGWGDYTNYALDTDGTLLWKFSSRDIGSDMAVGDVNNDGVDEIVLFTFCEVYVLDKNGNLVRTIQPHSGSAWSFGTLGDVNGDGIEDIIVAYAAYGTQEGWGVINSLYVYQSDGTLVWQKSYPLNPDGTPMNPILIDLTGNGVKDVVLLANKMVNAYRNDGIVLWTFSDFNPTRPWEIPITSFDLLKGDNKDEILFQWEQQLYILSLDGSLIQTVAIPNQGKWVSSGHIGKDPRTDNHYYEFGDINNDGTNELIVDEIVASQHYVAVISIKRPLPDFEISVSPEYAVADPHSSTEFVVTVKSLNGFNEPVTLSAVYSSHELSGSFEDTVVTPPSDGTVTTTLTVSVLSEAINTHQIYVTGTSGTLSHTKTATLHVPFMSVPFLSQGDAEWCVPTSFAMAMDFWGKDVKPWEIAEWFGIGHDDGMDMHDDLLDIRVYIRSQGLGYIEEYNLDKAGLQTLLGYGPVVLATTWTNQGTAAYHVVVVTGFYYDEFSINDPSGALLDEVFSTNTPVSHMQVEVSWGDLSPYIDFQRDPEAISITGTGTITPSTGQLNLVGGKTKYIRTIRSDHEGVDGPYIWESGAKTNPGETTGITWQYSSHQRSFDPLDKFLVGKDLTDMNDYLIVNPTSGWMDYEFHIIFSGPAFVYDRYCHVRIGPCGIANPSFDTIDLGASLGAHYGEYSITMELYDSQNSLIDRIELPKIRYGRLTRMSAHSPLNLFITDPQGRSIGVNPTTGGIVNEIPDAFYSGPGTEPQVIMIPDPINDTYSIILVGTATGDYSLTIEYITVEQTVTQTFSGTISEQEKQYYSALISETGEMTAISWEYVFKDPRRGTMLKISTDDKYFQFIAPDKDFGVKHDPKMKVRNHIIIICYEDSKMSLVATAVDDKIDFCSAIAWDKQTGKTYWLIDKPNWPRCYCHNFAI